MWTIFTKIFSISWDSFRSTAPGSEANYSNLSKKNICFYKDNSPLIIQAFLNVNYVWPLEYILHPKSFSSYFELFLLLLMQDAIIFLGGYLLIIDSFIIIDMNYVTKNKNKKKARNLLWFCNLMDMAGKQQESGPHHIKSGFLSKLAIQILNSDP